MKDFFVSAVNCLRNRSFMYGVTCTVSNGNGDTESVVGVVCLDKRLKRGGVTPELLKALKEEVGRPLNVGDVHVRGVVLIDRI